VAGRRRGRGTPGPQGPTPGSAADVQPDADPVEVAKTIIVSQLSFAPRTRAQLAEVLRRRGLPADAAEHALDRFSELGYVDDAAFSDAWVQSRHAGKGLSRRALEHELTRRGVAVETAREAAQQVDRDTERETALALVRRRLPSTRNQPTEARVRRLVGMLARKGYSSGLAFGVVREVLASEGEVLDDLAP
jgi:regulatory protein